MAHRWTQQTIFHKALSGSSPENYLILFPSITFKISFLRGLAATLSPTQLQLRGTRWQKNSWRFLYPLPACLRAQKTTWVDVACWKKYLQILWHQVRTSPMLTDPPGMAPGYCNTPKTAQLIRDLAEELLWCSKPPPLGAGGSEIWIWILTLASSHALASRLVWSNLISYHNYVIISPEPLGLFSATKIFVGFEQGKNHTEEENQQHL